MPSVRLCTIVLASLLVVASCNEEPASPAADAAAMQADAGASPGVGADAGLASGDAPDSPDAAADAGLVLTDANASPDLASDAAAVPVDAPMLTPVQAACTEYYQAFVARSTACPSPTARKVVPPGFCALLVNAPGSGLSASFFSACAAKVRAWPCDQAIEELGECSNLTAAGTRANGSPCAAGLQCASGFCRGGSLVFGLNCGQCAPRVPLGATCETSSSASPCEAGAACDQSTHQCTTRQGLKEGALCSNTGQGCETGFLCYGNPATCQRPKKEGATCAGIGECGGELVCEAGMCRYVSRLGGPCSSNGCAPGLLCNGMTHTCVTFTGKTEGQTCSLYDPEDQRCGAGLYCQRAKGADTGVCSAPKPDGAACAAGDRCAEPDDCIAGMCTPIDPAKCG